MAHLPQLSAPALSTPEAHLFEDPTPTPPPTSARLSLEEIRDVYEISRTAHEIRNGGWGRIALQFPDTMLCDAPRVFEELERELKAGGNVVAREVAKEESLETNFNALAVDKEDGLKREGWKIYILADTSYGSCCVDEIAAEHVDAEVVVHYGRSCLSPTARLPVIYVYTSRPLRLDAVVETFEDTYLQNEGKGKDEKILLMADITYHSHIPKLLDTLRGKGWVNVVAPEIIHEPSSLIPNRDVTSLGLGEQELGIYEVFHISDPPPALLLTLSSRVRNLNIYPTDSQAECGPTKALQSNTSRALMRRYGLLTSLSTCAIFGILINTLSVRNYLETVTHIKNMIEKAGKKSYTFVVGKVNAAKIANFSEIGGWVVIGCWESSLIDSTEFYKPIITPFELQMALQGDDERVWTGQWRGDFASLSLEDVEKEGPARALGEDNVENREEGDAGNDSEEESAPPEFDLRTGRYVSHSRPMRTRATPTAAPASNGDSLKEESSTPASSALIKRAKGELATVNGTVSPGAEYLRSQRTWTGLGSDFHEVEASSTIEEGRSGVARGYTVGDEERR